MMAFGLMLLAAGSLGWLSYFCACLLKGIFSLGLCSKLYILVLKVAKQAGSRAGGVGLGGAVQAPCAGWPAGWLVVGLCHRRHHPPGQRCGVRDVLGDAAGEERSATSTC